MLRVSMLTREEAKQYLKIKEKIEKKDVFTQTDDIDRIEASVNKEDCEPTDNMEALPASGIVIIHPQTVVISKDGSVHTYDNTTEEEFETQEETECEEEYSEYSDTEDEDFVHNLKRKTPYFGDEKHYFNQLPKAKQQKILHLEEEVKNTHMQTVPLRFRILESNMDMKLKAHAINKINTLNQMEPSSSEYFKLLNYIEALAKLPIGKYNTLPVQNTSGHQQIADFLEGTRKKLDLAVYGHDDAKSQIILLLAQWISNPQSKGLVIGIEGSMGCGKTTLVKDGICKVLGLPFGFVPLGGVSDGSYLVGHSYTYEGSKWGRIAEILMGCQCMNPILFLDELDKVSTTRHGEEIINMLIHLTDSTQNDSFHDKYFSDIPFDLSRCLVVFSFNNGELINPILRDRMITIKTSGYNTANKVEIAKHYMLPEIDKKFGFVSGDIDFHDDILQYIIRHTPEEQGVRNFRRSLEEIISKINLARLMKQPLLKKSKKLPEQTSVSLPLHVTTDIVDELLWCSKVKNTNVSLPMMYL